MAQPVRGGLRPAAGILLLPLTCPQEDAYKYERTIESQGPASQLGPAIAV